LAVRAARCDGRKWRRRSSQRRLEGEENSSGADKSEVEEDPLESRDDFFTGRDRVRDDLEVDDNEIEEDGLGSSNGLETGDSVIFARYKPLDSFEGTSSSTSSIRFEGVRAREWGMTSSSLDADRLKIGS
jgi:hypothetical protein